MKELLELAQARRELGVGRRRRALGRALRPGDGGGAQVGDTIERLERHGLQHGRGAAMKRRERAGHAAVGHAKRDPVQRLHLRAEHRLAIRAAGERRARRDIENGVPTAGGHALAAESRA